MEGLAGSNRAGIDGQRVVRQEQVTADAIARARLQAEQAVNRVVGVSAQQRIALGQYAEAALIRATQSGAGQRSAVLRLELAKELANIRRHAAQVESAQQGGGRFGGAAAGKFGKANMVAFGIQQSVEDYSFAGMRGMTNNLAMMTSMLGGPVGLGAMAALTAVNLGMMYSQMRGGDSAAEGAADRLERLVDAHREYNESKQGESRDIASRSPYEMAGSGNELKREMRESNRELRDSIANRQKELDIVNAVKAAREMEQTYRDVHFSGNETDTRRALEDYWKSLEDVGALSGGVVEDMDGLATVEGKAAEAFNEYGKSADDLRLKLAKFEHLQPQADALAQFASAAENLKECRFQRAARKFRRCVWDKGSCGVCQYVRAGDD